MTSTSTIMMVPTNGAFVRQQPQQQPQLTSIAVNPLLNQMPTQSSVMLPIMNNPCVRMSSIEQITRGFAGINIGPVLLDTPEYRSMKKIFGYFLRSGPHGAVWPNVTYCVVNLPYLNQVYWRKNQSNEVHAEVALMNYLLLKDIITLEYIAQKRAGIRTPTISIYLNYSPCYNCSQELIKLKTNSIQRGLHWIELDIVAAFPYKCYHDKCPGCKSRYFWKTKDKNGIFTYGIFQNNTQGLMDLSSNYKPVRAFNLVEWRNLSMMLSKYLPSHSMKITYSKEEYVNHVFYNEHAAQRFFKNSKTPPHNLTQTRAQADAYADHDFKFIGSPTFALPYHPDFYANYLQGVIANNTNNLCAAGFW